MIPVRELLDQLGADADAVAQFLLLHGFKGRRGVGEDCPIANYLKANGVNNPAVDVSTITHAWGAVLIVEELPEATENFVMMFDDGEFTALEATKE